MPDKNFQELVNNSGLRHQMDVVKKFRDRGWNVRVSPYYQDPFLGKPREVDLVVEKECSLFDVFDTHVGDYVVRFFIECKYLNKSTLFWMDEPNNYRLVHDILMESYKLPDPKDNVFTTRHRYYNLKKVAKVFEERDKLFFEGIGQVLHGAQYLKKARRSIRTKRFLGFWDYRVICCNSFDKICFVEEEDLVMPTGPSFQIEVDYIEKDIGHLEQVAKSSLFIIEVIDKTKLDDYLKIIEQDCKLLLDYQRGLNMSQR